MYEYQGKEFNELQMDVINRGLKEGIDVSSFANPELDWTVMQEAMYALYEDVDLTAYLTDFDSWQLSVIKDGLKEGYDVGVYAKPAYGHWEMEQILEGLRSGVDVSKYNDVRFEHDQMKFIRLQLEKGVNIDAFANPDYAESQMSKLALAQEQGLDLALMLNPDFNEAQMDVIRLGLKDGIDASVYADPDYSPYQMDVLRVAITNGEDVSGVLDPELEAYQMHGILKAMRYGYTMSRQFSGSQMSEINYGLEKGIDVSTYAKLDEKGEPIFNNLQMHQIRQGLCLHLNVEEFAKPEYTWRKMQSTIKKLVKEQYKEYFDKFDEAQLKTIFDGMLEGIDYEVYAKPEFSGEQMREIYIGLLAGLNVSVYAKPDYDMYQMSVIRIGLRDGIDVSSYLDPNLTSDEMYDIYENLCKMKRN